MRSVAVWTGRVVLMVAVIAFASLTVIFGVVTYLTLFDNEVGADRGMAALTGVLIPTCAAFAWGAGWLFADTFREAGP